MDQEKKEIIEEASLVPEPTVQLEDDEGYNAWLAGESQAVDNSDFNGIDDSLLCKEIFYSSSLLPNNCGLNPVSFTDIAHNTNEVTGNNNAPCGIADLENLELDTPPDFQLAVSIIFYTPHQYIDFRSFLRY